MHTYTTQARLRRALREMRQEGCRVAFVPTMGNLHEGHLQLARRAGELCDLVVASIFVNPMQFGPSEDLGAYPRTLVSDKKKLRANGVQMLYAPEMKDIYPDGMGAHSQVQVPDLADTLCGLSRPGHFTGVATVVAKLFNIVQPDVAVFGEKDYQQLLIIRRMVRDLCLPIEIVGVPTVREDDGLAMSSRNSYLTSGQRKTAPLLHQVLQECRSAIADGADNYRQLASRAKRKLTEAGFVPDYVEIRDAHTLHKVTGDTGEVVILAAARLGKPRLIDNVRLKL